MSMKITNSSGLNTDIGGNQASLQNSLSSASIVTAMQASVYNAITFTAFLWTQIASPNTHKHGTDSSSLLGVSSDLFAR